MRALAEVSHGESISVGVLLFLLELHVEILADVGSHDFEVFQRESLPEADSLATIEGDKATWAALLPVGREVELVVWIEALREELARTLPFF